MPNTYARLNLQTFKKKLKEGGYKTATGARRGLGRIQGWNKKDKATAARAIDRHFDGATPTKKTKKKARKKTAAKRSVEKKRVDVKASKKTAAKKTAAKAAPKKKKGKKRTPKKQSILEMFSLSEMTVGTMTQFVETLEKCRELSGIDVAKSVQMAADILEHDLQQLHSAVVPKSSDNGRGTGLTAQEKVEARKFAQSSGASLQTPPAPPSKSNIQA